MYLFQTSGTALCTYSRPVAHSSMFLPRPVAQLYVLISGQECIAQCTDDDFWYRAEVINVNKSGERFCVTVIFVDYGSQDDMLSHDR